VARRDGRARQRVAQCAGETPLVRRVAKREQQGDGDGFGRERAHGGDYTRHLPVRERLEHAGGPHALRSPHHVVPDHERRGVVACQVVQCRAILTSEP